MTNLYFEETEYYGWMDIGYFRCRPSLDIGKESIKLFPNKEKIQWLNPDKIHYALVNMDIEYMPSLINIIRSGNPIPPNQVSVAGGFFIGHKTKIGWWRDTYQYKLETYIAKSSLVKDDQIIIADCIFSELMGVNFELHHEFKPFRVSNAKRLTPVSLKNAHVMGVFNEKRCKRLYPRYDPWFLFSYYLL
jgi:hypothetical protein